MRRYEGEENFVGDSEIIALGGASNETKDRPLGYLNWAGKIRSR